MNEDAPQPEVLIRVPTEVEAAVIVGALRERGLQAEAVGGFTAGFRAEAPGDVAILVRQQELDQAKQVLAQFRREGGTVDWSQVDVGEPE